MANYLRTTGTTLHVHDVDADEIHNVKSSAISGVGGSRATSNIQNLQDESVTVIPGAITPTAASFTIYLDTGSVEQKALYQLYKTAKVVDFYVGLTDDPDLENVPTLAGSVLTLPESRSFAKFSGFITDFPLEFAVDSVVECSITVQMESAYEFIYKT
ncbi:hypothetical protein J7J47_03595 [Halomonas sp. ISL-60]|uniref:phage tail tube protein n=1 Tax=Halomonas sp. ISL-56 TaxID=2819149 RepID=UPI001BE6443B|nr:phage tail tube protein [Halomonas sp. ISL-56]MBT2771313.1 hypothetical protein [Halomonas sp. ISL-60]MBT2800670.1 hypothetical protein [Halomonas sp. ISL-56]